MVLRSALDPAFLMQVREWLDERGEVFVVIRYAYAAGSKDYLFVTSYEGFEKLLKTLPPRADVIVFREPQLPIRGIADESTLKRAITEIPDGDEWFLLCMEGNSPREFLTAGDNSHLALKDVFEELKGKHIAVGIDPPWHLADSPHMQSGRIPLPDGTIAGGAF